MNGDGSDQLWHIAVSENIGYRNGSCHSLAIALHMEDANHFYLASTIGR